MSLLEVLLVAAFSLVMTAFFSGAETGYMSVSRVRLRRAPDPDGPRMRRLLGHLRDIEDPILTCLVGTNLFNVLFTATMTATLTAHFGARGEWLSMIVSSVVIILFGEILPKVLYREFPERLALASVPAVGAAMVVLSPLRWLLRGYTGLWRRILPEDDARIRGMDRRDLAALLLANPTLDADDRRFAETLDRFLELAGHDLTGIMRPLEDVVHVGPDTTVGECLAVAARSGFSRLPISREDGRSLQAYVMVRDLIFLPREEHGEPVPRRFWRTFLRVDERMSPYELFEEMRSQGRQVAVVVDAPGNPRGLVTLEDLIEMVMGSIRDEFDHGAGLRGPAATKGRHDG